MQNTLITLEAIDAEQKKLAALIEAFKRQPSFPLTINAPVSSEGEIYVGTIINAQRSEHIFLLPGEFEGTWSESKEWAANIGGELPDRLEGALLFQVLKSEFKEEAHWTREEHQNNEYAWCQYFFSGGQGNYHKDDRLRARAVRRLPI